jgi:hypothetical protein
MDSKKVVREANIYLEDQVIYSESHVLQFRIYGTFFILCI